LLAIHAPEAENFTMIELVNKQIETCASGQFPACTPGGLLLKLLVRAADCTPDLDPDRPHSLVRASPFFDTARKSARFSMSERNQLVGVCAVVAPTRATVFKRMDSHSDKQQQDLPRCFLRENSGASKLNTLLKPKGREPRQANE
jgi:hypothetical protein